MMKERKIGRKMPWLPLTLAGLGGGLLCGFLGSGGGILFVWVLSKAIQEADARDIFAMTVLTVIPLTAVSVVMYRLLGIHSGPLFTQSQLYFLIPAAIGGFFGAGLLDKLSTKALKKLFGGILLIGGLLMVVR